jgi:hypothetical protein
VCRGGLKLGVGEKKEKKKKTNKKTHLRIKFVAGNRAYVLSCASWTRSSTEPTFGN